MATSTVAVMFKMAYYLAAIAAFSPAVAVADVGTTSAIPVVPEYLNRYSMMLSLKPAEAGPMVYQYSVAPLTAGAGLNVTNMNAPRAFNVQGTMVNVDRSNYDTIPATRTIIAYISCDSNTTDSSVTPNDILDTWMNNRPKAIILYSRVAEACSLGGDNLSYTSIWTMISSDESQMVTNVTDAAKGTISAVISANSTAIGSDSNGAGEGTNNSAIAMSILYSITGLITLLFLTIIATGAIRAHRHPERYGPNAGYGGRPRQSRARGIARAVLETLPIVKFGDPHPAAKPDPEHELESVSVSGERHQATAVPVQSKSSTEAARSAKASAETRADSPSTSAADAGLANSEGAVATKDKAVGDEHLGCSICTDDFTVGEDVRVLPCDHKFHPPCIDPWLVNVSGTCPLCRLDLHPQRSNDQERNSGDQESPEDVLPADDANELEAAQRRRRSRLQDWNSLRHAPVDERIRALRQYREEQGDSAADASPEDRTRRARLADRLRDRFHIRTRTLAPDSAETLDRTT